MKKELQRPRRMALALAAFGADAHALELDLGKSNGQGCFDNTIKGGFMYLSAGGRYAQL